MVFWEWRDCDYGSTVDACRRGCVAKYCCLLVGEKQNKFEVQEMRWAAQGWAAQRTKYLITGYKRVHFSQITAKVLTKQGLRTITRITSNCQCMPEVATELIFRLRSIWLGATRLGLKLFELKLVLRGS